MRVRDLRLVIDEVRRIFTVSGAKSQESGLAQVSAALEQHDDQALDAYLEQVRQSAPSSLASPRVAESTRRLAEASLDEGLFLKVLADLNADKSLKKADLQKIVEAYTGSFDSRANASKLIDAIRRAFYKKLYERDARELARRATPVRCPPAASGGD
jgi:hypothetical protein